MKPQADAEQLNCPGQGRRPDANMASLSLSSLLLQGWLQLMCALGRVRGKEEGQRFWPVCAVSSVYRLPLRMYHTPVLSSISPLGLHMGTLSWKRWSHSWHISICLWLQWFFFPFLTSLSILLLSLQGDQNNPREMTFLSSFFLITFFHFIFIFYFSFVLLFFLLFSFADTWLVNMMKPVMTLLFLLLPLLLLLMMPCSQLTACLFLFFCLFVRFCFFAKSLPHYPFTSISCVSLWHDASLWLGWILFWFSFLCSPALCVFHCFWCAWTLRVCLVAYQKVLHPPSDLRPPFLSPTPSLLGPRCL